MQNQMVIFWKIYSPLYKQELLDQIFQKGCFNSNIVMDPLPLDWLQYQYCTLSSTAKVNLLTDSNTTPGVGLAGQLCADLCTK